MSKGLEKLKTIRHIHDMECGKDESINKDFDIIEKELKRLDELDNGAYVSIHINRYSELCDKEEALQIIKKKQVSVGTLLVLDNLQQYNDYCDMVGGCKKLTEEEYDLVKEALL